MQITAACIVVAARVPSRKCKEIAHMLANQ